MYLECHITMLEETVVTAARFNVEKAGWKYSCIVGDPTLDGEKLVPSVYQYATKNFPCSFDLEQVKAAMGAVATALDLEGLNVIRQKIELVLYDKRQP